MSIRALLNSGRSNETALEMAADIVLAFPRVMWHGRSVKVEMQANGRAHINENSNGRWNGITNDFGRMFSGRVGGFGLGAGLIIMGPLFLAACLLAAPLFGVGLLLKKVAISQDPAAAKVSAKVEQFLRNEELIKKEDELRKECARLQRNIEYAKRNIERSPTQSWQDFKKSYEDELVQAEKEMEEIHNELGPAIVPHLLKVKNTLAIEQQESIKKSEALQERIATLHEDSQEQRVLKARLKLQYETLQLEINKLQEEISALEKKVELLKTKEGVE